MKPHTYSTVTITAAQKCSVGIRVVASIRQNWQSPSDYSVLVKNAPKNIDLRLPGERDLLCILVEEEILRLQSMANAPTKTDLVTNCCNGDFLSETDICNKCGEHSLLVSTI